MSADLISQILDLITREGTEFKSVRSAIGDLSSLSTTAKSSLVAAINELLTNKIATAAIGANNGVAGLDSSGKLVASQWPTGIDKILEYANLAAFPGAGASNVIYLALDTNHEYRWSGSTYLDITAAGGGVSLFNGRTGTVVPTAGDYDAFYYTKTQIGDITTDFVAAFNTALT